MRRQALAREGQWGDGSIGLLPCQFTVADETEQQAARGNL
jgi:hypothetical protein